MQLGLKPLMITLVLSGSLVLSACEHPETAEGAASGAVYGAAVGGLANLVVGLVFDDHNTLERAARGAVRGAVVGAVAGGVQGSARGEARKTWGQQAQQKQQATPGGSLSDAELAALRQELGNANYAALEALSECRRDSAYSRANGVYWAASGKEKEYALVIKALVHEDRGDRKAADKIYAQLVTEAPDIGTVDKVRKEGQKIIKFIAEERPKFGIPSDCS